MQASQPGRSLVEQEFVVTWNTNRIELDSWIDQRKREDGDYDLIGMGRCTEYDSKTGQVVRNEVKPTGLVGWAPGEFFDKPRASWWRRLFSMEV